MHLLPRLRLSVQHVSPCWLAHNGLLGMACCGELAAAHANATVLATLDWPTRHTFHPG
jgi:hypothetical protein